MNNSMDDWNKRVVDAYAFFARDGLTIDMDVNETLCILTEIFLRYLVASTVDCMPQGKLKIEYDDIHRAVMSDRGLLFLSGVFHPQISLNNIRKRRKKIQNSQTFPSRKKPAPIDLD